MFSVLLRHSNTQPLHHGSYHSSTWASAGLKTKAAAFAPSVKTTKKADSGVLLAGPTGGHGLLFLLPLKVNSWQQAIPLRSLAYHRAHTLHLTQRHIRTNLCDVDCRNSEHPEETPTHTLSQNKSITVSLVIYCSVYGANVCVYSQSSACAFIRKNVMSIGCAHMN